jgi:hypothetical protein
MYASHHDGRGRNQLSPDDIAFERNVIANKSKAIQQGSNLIFYDGFMMQRLLGNFIQSENSTGNMHIVFDSRLTSLNVAFEGSCHKYLFALALKDIIVFHPFNYGFTMSKAC